MQKFKTMKTPDALLFRPQTPLWSVLEDNVWEIWQPRTNQSSYLYIWSDRTKAL